MSDDEAKWSVSPLSLANLHRRVEATGVREFDLKVARIETWLLTYGRCDLLEFVRRGWRRRLAERPLASPSHDGE